MRATDARKKLKRLLADRTESWDLAEAALLISSEVDPELEPRAFLALLDGWASELRGRLIRRPGLASSLDEMAAFLGDEQGLAGNSQNYYDPENSLLNRVLERKTGIPISLSIIYLSMAERLRLPLKGIPLPGHFLVGIQSKDLWYDPFDKGKRLRNEDLAAILRRLFGPEARLTDEMLKPSGKRQILARMVRNLKYVYISRQDLPRLLWCADLGLSLEPREADLLKERGLVRYQLGHYQLAKSDLQGYLKKLERKKQAPAGGEDAGRQHVELLNRVLAAMN